MGSDMFTVPVAGMVGQSMLVSVVGTGIELENELARRGQRCADFGRQWIQGFGANMDGAKQIAHLVLPRDLEQGALAPQR